MSDLKRKFLYQQLTDYLLTKLPKRYHGNFYSWIENGKLVNQGKNITANGIEIAHIKYDAVFWFDAFPYRDIQAPLIMAFIQVWLNENDLLRDQLDHYESDFNLDILDDKTADLSFTISFEESLTAMENNEGSLVIDNVNYKLEDIEIYYAEEIDVEIKK